VRYSLKLTIGFIFFVFGILFSLWISSDSTQVFLIENYEFEPYDCKDKSNQQCFEISEDCKCKAGPYALKISTFITILILVPLAYSIIFLLFLISRYHVKSILTHVIVEIPRKKIEKIIELNENDDKLIVYFVALSSIITILTGLAMLNFPTSDMINKFAALINTVDVTGIISSTVNPDNALFPQVASETLLFKVGIVSFIFLAIGPFWVLLLRKIRKFRKQNGENKHSGSKSLLFYLYLIFVLLIFHNNENPILKFKIYESSTLSEVENLVFIVGLSVVISLIVFGIDRFVIRRFESLET